MNLSYSLIALGSLLSIAGVLIDKITGMWMLAAGSLLCAGAAAAYVATGGSPLMWSAAAVDLVIGVLASRKALQRRRARGDLR